MGEWMREEDWDKPFQNEKPLRNIHEWSNKTIFKNLHAFHLGKFCPRIIRKVAEIREGSDIKSG